MLYDWAESKTMKGDVSLFLYLVAVVFLVSGCVGNYGSRGKAAKRGGNSDEIILLTIAL
jgi:hypothetical protein